jgi:HlyD family secretion protein
LCTLKAGEHPHLIVLCERSVDRLREQARHLRAEADRLEKTLARGATSDNERNEAVTKANQAEIALREKEAELLYLKNKVRAEQISVAEAEVRQAEAAVAEAEQRLADTRLAAPFDGVVLKYLKREGEGVSPLMPPESVVLFGDISRFRVRAEVDERYARLVVMGQPAEVYGRNVGGRVSTGRVVEVERVMGDKTLFSRSASERKDLHVVQAIVEMGDDFTAPVGLQVDVRLIHAPDCGVASSNRRSPLP